MEPIAVGFMVMMAGAAGGGVMVGALGAALVSRAGRRFLLGGILTVGAVLLLLAGGAADATGAAPGPPGPPGDKEFNHLLPHIKDACGVVRETPEIWPYRSFPYGPLGLEVRKAASAAEADRVRSFYLGAVGAACGLKPEEITRSFFCGPECPAGRRNHMVGQLTRIRTLTSDFEAARPLRLVAIWAPKGELRVNDLFVMDGRAREAVPSPKMGFVPSGDWTPWPNLAAYLKSIDVPEAKVVDMSHRMLDLGISALIRGSTGIRAVGVGVGDNESGLMLMAPGAPPPQVGQEWPDGRKLTIVEKVADSVFYYETT